MGAGSLGGWNRDTPTSWTEGTPSFTDSTCSGVDGPPGQSRTEDGIAVAAATESAAAVTPASDSGHGDGGMSSGGDASPDVFVRDDDDRDGVDDVQFGTSDVCFGCFTCLCTSFREKKRGVGTQSAPLSSPSSRSVVYQSLSVSGLFAASFFAHLG